MLPGAGVFQVNPGALFGRREKLDQPQLVVSNTERLAVLPGLPAWIPIHGEADLMARGDWAFDLPETWMQFLHGQRWPCGILERIVKTGERFFPAVFG